MKRKMLYAAAFVGIVGTASARPAPGLQDIVGARGSSLEFAMQQKGFSYSKSKGLTSFYWNSGKKQCVAATVGNGRVTAIAEATSGDCGHKGGILMGAMRAAEFNRGKSDAMANKPYATNDSDDYHAGYMEGERLRSGGHADHGVAKAKINDLAGISSIRAIDVMSERGFTGVDSIEMPGTQYGIYFNRATHQCVQLTMADGKVVSADDIVHHPKCR